MNEQLLNHFINSTKEFFLNRSNINKIRDKSILVNVGFLDAFAVITTMKIARAVSEVLDGDILVIPHFKAGQKLTAIIRSFCPNAVLPIKYLLLCAFFEKLFPIIGIVLRLKTGEDLVGLRDNHLKIGLHIYDAILARTKISTIEFLTIKQRIQIAFDLIYYFALKKIFQQRIDFVVLPDNTYRDGLVYELMKAKGMPCLVGIDLNGISIHKNSTFVDYDDHCRVPDLNLLHDLTHDPKVLLAADEYALIRFSGKEMQHDTMRAFSEHKVTVTRVSLDQEYGLDPMRKLILVMAHIFCDAPHALPDILFRDFEIWLIETCKQLAMNSDVEFLVKEHPSSSLYSENGLIVRILSKINMQHKLLSSNVNTRSLFNCVDAMVTCGGTGGMEFPCFGVPVLLAARPAYSQFGYSIIPKTKEAYFIELQNLKNYMRLDDNKIRMAKVVLYVINVLMRVPKKGVGLGTQEYYRGSNLDLNIFLEEMISDYKDSAGYSNLVKNMELLLNGKYKNLYRHETL